MKNSFEDKTDEELALLYKQFLEFEKTGIICDNELSLIRDKYLDMYGDGGAVTMVQFDILHTIADRWYGNKACKSLIERYNNPDNDMANNKI